MARIDARTTEDTWVYLWMKRRGLTIRPWQTHPADVDFRDPPPDWAGPDWHDAVAVRRAALKEKPPDWKPKPADIPHWLRPAPGKSR